MKNLYKQKREQGFTIIEVMIVLAIAAVILLIVLLAVPALQRNSRNTQRNNDAAQMAAAINTCLTNQNGLTTACQAQGVNSVDIDLT
jgi:prepilin-type N-terminal cleavage/methylation domain-containing protein